MSNAADHPVATHRPPIRALIEVALGLIWHAIRLPLLALLAILQPIVSTVLSATALLTLLTAFLFKFLDVADFPFWGMLAISVACILLLSIYYRLLRLLL